MIRRTVAVILALVIGLLAACGGGGGGGPGTSHDEVRIDSVSPLFVGPGGVVTVRGAGFLLLDGVAVNGGASGHYTVIDDQTLEAEVPADAQASGRVTLQRDHTDAASSTEVVTVAGQPEVVTQDRSAALPGDTVTLEGQQLDSVTHLTVGGRLAALGEHTAERLTFVVPQNAHDGTVELGTADGHTMRLWRTLQIPVVVSVTGVSPVAAQIGDLIRVQGTGLAGVGKVTVGGVPATVTDDGTDTEITVVVPPGAGSGTVEIQAGTTRVSAPSTVRIKPATAAVSVTGTTPASGSSGTVITVNGSGLDGVAAVTIDGAPAPVLVQTATTLQIMGERNGAVRLITDAGTTVDSGQFVVAEAELPQPTIVGVELGQNFLQEAGARYQRLVPGKAALMRANITSATLMASPRVTALIKRDGALLGALQLQGPPLLPRQVAQRALAESFTGVIPDQWVQPGLAVTIEVATTHPANGGASRTVTPPVGGPVNLDVVLVPLQRGEPEETGVVPPLDELRAELARVYPLSPSQIRISVRAPVRLKNPTVAEAGLYELNALRQQEGSTAVYFGLAPRRHAPGTEFAGIAILGTSNTGADMTGLGMDFRSGLVNASRVIAHEIGHVLGLSHAPCGAPSQIEPQWPTGAHYDGALLGPSPLLDAGTLVPLNLTRASERTDLMGYCEGIWLSDFHYHKLQAFLEQRLFPSMQAQAAGEVLDITGRYVDGRITLSPLNLRTGGIRASAGRGPWSLRLTTQAGERISLPFAMKQIVDSASSSALFTVSLPNPGPLQSLEVWNGTAAVPVVFDLPPAPSGSRRTQQDVASTLDWKETGGRLRVTWDARRYPVLHVTHVHGTQRRVMALALAGGQAEVPVTDVPRGGFFEFGLSNGLQAEVRLAPR